MARFYLICFTIAIVRSSRPEKDLPSYFPRCFRNDPDINGCLLKATDQVRPYLAKGVPELHIPSISPFFIPEISLEQGTEAVNYKASMKNISIVGLDTYKFTKFDFDVKNLIFDGEVNMGQLYMKGNVTIDGRILVAPIQGQGISYVNITNSNGTLHQQAKLVSNKGVVYLKPSKTMVKINVGEVTSHIEGLFDGNDVLARATNNVIKDNINDLVLEVKPEIEKAMTTIIEQLIIKTIYNIPYDKLYPLKD